MPKVGEPYNITPMDMVAVFNGLVSHHPADDYGYKKAIRMGWKAEFDEGMKEKRLEKN